MLLSSSIDHAQQMSWKSVRLELARSPGFPRGSASRAFLLRLPLRAGGSIDAGAIDDNESRATFHRFWASEPDLSGRIVSHEGSWQLCCTRVGSCPVFVMRDSPLVADQNILIEGPDEIALPFRVVSIDPLSAAHGRTS
jgi:hypothetical protein